MMAMSCTTLLIQLPTTYEKPGQVGTKMSLARNPNTPDDILLDVAQRDVSWQTYIQESLEANPRYKEIKQSNRSLSRPH
jgi:hypothetical protein